MGEIIKRYFIARFREPSTWRGIIAFLVGAVGWDLPESAQAQLVIMALAAMGFLGIIFPDALGAPESPQAPPGAAPGNEADPQAPGAQDAPRTRQPGTVIGGRTYGPAETPGPVGPGGSAYGDPLERMQQLQDGAGTPVAVDYGKRSLDQLSHLSGND